MTYELHTIMLYEEIEVTTCHVQGQDVVRGRSVALAGVAVFRVVDRAFWTVSHAISFLVASNVSMRSL